MCKKLKRKNLYDCFSTDVAVPREKSRKAHAIGLRLIALIASWQKNSQRAVDEIIAILVYYSDERLAASRATGVLEIIIDCGFLTKCYSTL